MFRIRCVCQYPITPLPALLVPTPNAFAPASLTQAWLKKVRPAKVGSFGIGIVRSNTDPVVTEKPTSKSQLTNRLQPFMPRNERFKGKGTPFQAVSEIPNKRMPVVGGTRFDTLRVNAVPIYGTVVAEIADGRVVDAQPLPKLEYSAAGAAKSNT